LRGLHHRLRRSRSSGRDRRSAREQRCLAHRRGDRARTGAGGAHRRRTRRNPSEGALMSVDMATATTEGTARERLLAAASELFYREGIHTVGIDRVIERAGVAKASLYNTFGSKDELIRAYLEQRRAGAEARVNAAIEKWSTPREKLLAIYAAQ